MINLPSGYKKHKSVEDLFSAFLAINKKDLKNIILGSYGHDKKKFFKKIKNNIEKTGAWGFIDDKKIIHYWIGKKATEKILIQFFAHEIGHLNGKQYKNPKKEELKACKFEQVAGEAFRITRTIILTHTPPNI